MKRNYGMKLLRLLAVLFVAVLAVFMVVPAQGNADYSYVTTYEAIGRYEAVNESDTYILYGKNGSNYSVYYGSDDLKAATASKTAESGFTTRYLSDGDKNNKLMYVSNSANDTQWGVKFESAGNGEYYIKTKSGKYLHSYYRGYYGVETVDKKSKASKFKFTDMNTIYVSDDMGHESLFITSGNELDTEWANATPFKIYRLVPTSYIKRLVMHVNGVDVVLQENNQTGTSIVNVTKVAAPCFLKDLPEDTVLTFTATSIDGKTTATCNTLTVGDIIHNYDCLRITLNTENYGTTMQYYQLVFEDHAWGVNTGTTLVTPGTCSTNAVYGYYCTGFTKLIFHTWGSEVSTASCSHILRTYEMFKDPNNHNWVTYNKPATCKETGISDARKCSWCGKVEGGTVIPRTEDHVYNVVGVVDEGDCQTEKTVRIECQVCGKTTTRTDGYGAHVSVEDAAVPATCYSEGTTAGTHCSVCEVVLSGHETVAKLEHTWDEGVVETDALCESEGTMLYTCTVDGCGATKREAISALGHTPEEVAEIPATCTVNGVSAYTRCSVCQAELTAKTTISAFGHTSVTDEAVAPTCETAGLTEGSHCSVCEVILAAQETVAALGHSYDNGTETQALSCTTDGITVFACTRTGCEHTTTVTVKATGHSYSSEVTTAATCEKEGVMTYTCVNDGCADTYTEAIASRGGHIFKITSNTVPTCEADGITRFDCENCDAGYSVYTMALGHNYTSVVTKNPTTTEEGIRTYTCQNDASHQYTEAISKLPAVVEEEPEEIEIPEDNTPAADTPATEEPENKEPETTEPADNGTSASAETTEPAVTEPEQTVSQPEQEATATTVETTEIGDDDVAKSAGVEDEPAVAVAEPGFNWLILLIILLAVATACGYLYVKFRQNKNKTQE